MKVFQLAIVFTIFFLFGCKINHKEIIAQWHNGQTRIERTYSDTPNCFLQREYYDNGQLENETKFIDSIKTGPSIAYYRDGNPAGKCIYKNGKINGDVFELYENGNHRFKGYQINGELIGKATHYYENGKPETELFYKDKTEFLVNIWDSSGVQQIINGEGIRKFADYLEKDKKGNDTTIYVSVVGIYKDSLQNGLWKYYNASDGKLILEINFKDDKEVSETWK
jgi:antitoxin component YwqK of YwqJK toxin-antitoxin module